MRLRQVLTNLAGNAVKFTGSGGVCVSIGRVEGNALRFAVTDTGPGVPADRRKAIFEELGIPFIAPLSGSRWNPVA
jgi:signal transduction histidine kinase